MKQFKDLDLSNGFLFASALSDVETCRLVLEIILGFPVPNLRVSGEHTILFSSDFRSVRLDIYARDEMEVIYDVEMQGQKNPNLPKRSRYHQAEMDLDSLKPGEDFSALKPNYVIFICTFDPFDRGCYRYVFENYCRECGISLGDETYKIFLNTKGKNDHEVPPELVHFLKYVENTTDSCVALMEDKTVGKIHQKVKELKKSRELEARYMTMEEFMRGLAEELAVEIAEERAVKMAEERAVKMAEELAVKIADERAEKLVDERAEMLADERVEKLTEEREEKILSLVSALAADGDMDTISRLPKDKVLLAEKLAEYNL